ncbi:hypothetical protein [Bacillus atrophaeus]|uniref:hypothetical protein n=1 Tax=Bacillus atrophaeus TaxID=1452 RepID=UPI00228156B0|nr:hypothetical protein [Bacillus atrophaeus]MCY9165996.1 hypothetical protein [Bacillus atrophaeus]
MRKNWFDLYLYVKHATKKARESRSLVKPYNKIKNFQKELLNKQFHFNQFNKVLEAAVNDKSSDIWLFEYNTYLFMLQKVGQYKELKDLEEVYFPVLASLMIVGDIRLKLLLVETLFNTSSGFNYKNKLSSLFLLSIVIIPFFKEYIKSKLLGILDKVKDLGDNSKFKSYKDLDLKNNYTYIKFLK